MAIRVTREVTDLKVVWIAFVISQYGNAYCGEVRETTKSTYDSDDCRMENSMFNIYKKIGGYNSSNVDDHFSSKFPTYDYTIGTNFFNCVKNGMIRCAQDTKVWILLEHMSEREKYDWYKGEWGSIDYFDVTNKECPFGKVLTKHLVTQIKGCRSRVDGTLIKEDIEHVQENWKSNKLWCSSSAARRELLQTCNKLKKIGTIETEVI